MTEFSIYDELMPKIQALIQPPEYGAREKLASGQFPFYKRRARRHNHDYCDACEEKGNLLYCENCPTSFHLLCCNPPVTEDEIPQGPWYCHACTIIAKNDTNRFTEIVRAPSNSTNEIENRNFNYVSAIKNMNQKNERVHDNAVVKSVISDKNLSIAASKIENDVFERKKEMTCEELRITVRKCDDVSSENDSRISKKQCNLKINAMKTQSRVSEIGKKFCNRVMEIRGIFSAAIEKTKQANPKQFRLPSEYLEDLDNNVIIDNKEMDYVPIDFDSNDLLKLPPRRCFYCNGNCLLGDIISCDFCFSHFHLNCLDPPMCSPPDMKWMCPLHPHHILEKVMKNPNSITELSSWWKKLSVSVDDDNVKSEFVSKVKAVQRKYVSNLNVRSISKIPDIIKFHYQNLTARIPSLDNLFNSDDVISNSEDTLPADYKVDTDIKELNSNQLVKPISNTVIEKNETDIGKGDDDDSFYPKITAFCDSKSECEKHVEVSTSWSSNNKNDQHVFENGADETSWQHIRKIVIDDIQRNFSSEDDRLKRNPLFEEYLLNQKIYSIVRDFPPSLKPCSLPYPYFPPPNGETSQILPHQPQAKVHAVLCPLSHRAPLVFMYENILNVGTGFSNDVCLRNFGHCNLLSDSHAVIYFDKFTKMYELLNYSEYCTVVDGVTYTCDLSRFYYKNEAETWNQDSENALASAEMKQDFAVIDMNKNEKFPRKSAVGEVNDDTDEPRGSAITAAETRNTYKKLLHDIDKLVMKTQREMSLIADEDLNEISKIIKFNRYRRDSSLEKQKIKQKPKTDYILKMKGHKVVAQKVDSGSENSEILSFHEKTGKNSRLEDEVPKFFGKSDTRSNIQASISESQNQSAGGRKRGRPPLNRKNSESQIQDVKRIKVEERSDEEIENVIESDNTVQDRHVFQYVNDLELPKKKKLCQCQLDNIKLPIGRDSSWEKSAPLHHGSYIRFGCLEFVFSIVNYPVKFEDRSYSRRFTKKSTPSNENDTIEKCDNVSTSPDREKDLRQNNLSMKLISILNALSKSRSESLSASESASLTSTRDSSRNSSPIFSRSTSLDKSHHEQISSSTMIEVMDENMD